LCLQVVGPLSVSLSSYCAVTLSAAIWAFAAGALLGLRVCWHHLLLPVFAMDTDDSAALLRSLHGALLRPICRAISLGCGGLTTAARQARCRGLVGSRMRKRLENIGVAFAAVRHLSHPKVQSSIGEVKEMLSHQGHPSPAPAAHASTGGPGALQPPRSVRGGCRGSRRMSRGISIIMIGLIINSSSRRSVGISSITIMSINSMLVVLVVLVVFV